jgi:hypothetical protein
MRVAILLLATKTGCGRDLNNGPRGRHSFNRQQFVQMKLKSDAEHQKDHPDFGELIRQFRVGDESRRISANHNPSQQVFRGQSEEDRFDKAGPSSRAETEVFIGDPIRLRLKFPNRAGGIRTHGLYVPNVALYQAEPQPVCRLEAELSLPKIESKPIPRSFREVLCSQLKMVGASSLQSLVTLHRPFL